MPRPDKATFIQNMLSELEHQQNGSAPITPEPDSKEWWREVAQELGVKAQQAEASNARLRAALEQARTALHQLCVAVDAHTALCGSAPDWLLRDHAACAAAVYDYTNAALAETDEDYPQCEQS